MRLRGLIPLVLATLALLGLKPTAANAQNSQAFYSDGVNSSRFQITGDAHLEDTYVSIYAGFSSPGIMVFKDTDPMPPQTYRTNTGSGIVINPAPVAGPGLPVSFGTYQSGVNWNLSDVLDFGVLPKGNYRLYDVGEYYQAAPPDFQQPKNAPEGPVSTRFINIDSITQINPPTPPTTTPDPAGPGTVTVNLYQPPVAAAVVSVAANIPVAYRPGNGHPAVSGSFVLTRTGGNIATPLVVNYGVSGSAVNNTDYNSNTGSWPTSTTITFPAGQSQVTENVIPLIGKGSGNPPDNTIEKTVVITLNSGSYSIANSPATVWIEPAPRNQQYTPTIAFTQPTTVSYQKEVTYPGAGQPIYPGTPVNIAVRAYESLGSFAAVFVTFNDSPYAAVTSPSPGDTVNFTAPSFTPTQAGDYVFKATAQDSNGVSTLTPDTTLIVHVSPKPDVPPTIRWDDTGSQVDGTPNLPSFHPVPYSPDAPPNGPNLPDWYESDVYPGDAFDPRAIATAGVLANGTSQGNLTILWVDHGDDSPPTSNNYVLVSAGGGATLETPSKPFVAVNTGDVYHFVARTQDATGTGSRTIHLAVKVLPPPPPVPNVAPTVLWDDTSYQPTNDSTTWTVTVSKGSSLKITATGYDSFPPQNLGDLGVVKVNAAYDSSDMTAASLGTASATDVGNTVNIVRGAGGTAVFNMPGTFQYSAQAQQDPHTAVQVHHHAAAINSNIIHLVVVVTDPSNAKLRVSWVAPGPVTQVSSTLFTAAVQVSATPQNVTSIATDDNAALATLIVWQIIDDPNSATGFSVREINGVPFAGGTTTGACPCPFVFGSAGVYHFCTQAYGADGLLSGYIFFDVTANDGSVIDHPPAVTWAAQANFTPNATDLGAPNTWSVQTVVGTAVNVGAVGADADNDFLYVYVDPRNDRPTSTSTPHTAVGKGTGSATAPASFTPTAVGTYYFSARSQESRTGTSGPTDPANLGSPSIHLVVNVSDGTAHPPFVTWVSPVGLTGIQRTSDPTTFTVDATPNVLLQLDADFTDPDGDLIAGYIDARFDTPPTTDGQFAYAGFPGVGNAIVGNVFAVAPGQTVPFSAKALDSGGRTYLTHLIVHGVNAGSSAPPTVQWLTPANLLPVSAGKWEFYVHQGDTQQITAQGTSDGSNLHDVWLDNADDVPPGTVLVSGVSAAGTAVNAVDSSVTFSALGDYTFSARADDYAGQSSATIKLVVHVVPASTTALPTVKWLTVNGASALVPPAPGAADPTLWTLAKPVAPGTPYVVYAQGNDIYGNLNFACMDQGYDIPPVASNLLTSNPGGNGYQCLLGWRDSFLIPGDHYYSAIAKNPTGSSSVIHLKITIAGPSQPPTVEWTNVPGLVADADGVSFEAPGSLGMAGPQATGRAPNLDLGSVSVTGPNGSQVFSQITSPDGKDTTTPAVSGSPYNIPGDYVYYASAQTAGDPTLGRASLPSPTIKLTVHVANHAPVVAWVDPTGSTYTPTNDPATVTATMYLGDSLRPMAAGQDQDGNLSGVYVDLADDAPPVPNYAFAAGDGGDGYSSMTDSPVWTPTNAGVFTFSARALDAQGAFSGVVRLLVTVKGHDPTIQWLQPLTGVVNKDISTSLYVGDNMTSQVEGVAVDGDLVRLEVSKDGAPFDFEYFYQTNLRDSNQGSTTFTSPGRHQMTARAWTRAGLLTNTPSPTITLNVNVLNRAPNFEFTVPTVINTYVGQSVAITGVGTDQDGNLVRDTVTSSPAGFGNSATSTDTGSLPISFAFTPSAQGVITFNGQATDDQGATSPTRQVTVYVDPANRPPTVSFTSPATGVNATATAVAGQQVQISALGSDPDNNLAVVNINYQGNSFASQVSSGPPVSAIGMWTPPGPGTYVFTAVAVDSGSTGHASQPALTSAPATLTIVVTNHEPTVQWQGITTGAPDADANVNVFVNSTQTITAHGADPDGDLSNVTMWIGSSQTPASLQAQGKPDATKVMKFPYIGSYQFHAQAVDSAGLKSPIITLNVTVTDYPVPDGPVTISAVVVSGADHPEDATGQAEPVVIQGGVISLGDAPLGPGGVPPVQIKPVDGYLRGQMIPPVVPYIIDMRIQDTSIKATNQ